MATESAVDTPPGSARHQTSLRMRLAVGLSIVWVVWQAYIAGTVPLAPVPMRTVHLGFAFVIAFLLFPSRWQAKSPRLTLALDLALGALAVVILAHLFREFSPPDFRRVVNPLAVDLALAVAMLGVVLLGVWRTTGLALPLTALVFIAYAFVGQELPGAIGHGGYDWQRVLSILYLELDGVLGSIVGISATLIFPVLLFGGMLVALGGGEFFTDLAMSAFGRVRGAAGKVAVVSSAMFATVAGTGGANVATTGVFTIPLMKRTGYRPANAAAIEATASIGGQIMPPVMGAAAFIMVEFVGESYSQIVRHALIPAALFFFAVFLIVHLEAVKAGMVPLEKELIPKKGEVYRKGWQFVPPLLLLLYIIGIQQGSVARAAYWSTILLLLLEFGRRLVLREPLELGRFVDGCVNTAKSAALVATAVAAIQLLIAVVGLTGLGIKLSSLLLLLAGDSLLLLLVLTMIASIILGTGLPTVPTYLVLAILTAPALTEMGVPLIAAHFFVFYFGVWSDLTPPTALGPTIGAGIAGAPLVRTMFESMRLGLIGFVLPFAFVYQPGLLLVGSRTDVLTATAFALAGITLVCFALAGYFVGTVPTAGRLLLLASGALLISPTLPAELLGLGLGAATLAVLFLRRPAKDARQPLPSPRTLKEEVAG